LKNCNASEKPAGRRILPIACAAALAMAFAVALPAHADQVTPPPVPPDIQVPADAKAFLLGHAIGTQNYVCLPAGVDSAGQPLFAWRLFTPEATLFNDDLKEIVTHFFSPNLGPNALETSPNPPFADGPIRAAWQHSRDASTVWARTFLPTDASTDSRFVEKGAIAWLKLTVVGSEAGPTGGDVLTNTAFIHRLNTSGGAAPLTGCASSTDVGNQAFVPYTADYFFYK
jgi:hypothetical protein